VNISHSPLALKVNCRNKWSHLMVRQVKESHGPVDAPERAIGEVPQFICYASQTSQDSLSL